MCCLSFLSRISNKKLGTLINVASSLLLKDVESLKYFAIIVDTMQEEQKPMKTYIFAGCYLVNVLSICEYDVLSIRMLTYSKRQHEYSVA